MLEPIYKTKFKKDLKLMEKRGKSIDKLKTVIRLRIPEDLITNSVRHLIIDSRVFDHFNASRRGLSFKGV